MKRIILLFAFVISAHMASAQVYLGGGYVRSSLGISGLEVVKGVEIHVQRPYDLIADRLYLLPTLQMHLLTSNIERDVYAFYTTTLTLAPMISYDFIKSQNFGIAPYIGPYVGWLRGLRSGDVLFESAQRNELIKGIQFGIELHARISEHFQLKVLPMNFQKGRDFFEQRTLSLLFKL